MKTDSRGFTLIEVALAVLIVGIGILAVAALFSTGLNSSAKAVADTQASMFAENVFNGLRARSLLMAERQTATNKTWNAFWTNFIGKTTGVTIAAVAPDWGVWTNATTIRVGGPYTQVFMNIPKHPPVVGAAVTGIVNHALRYSISAWMTNVVSSNFVSARVNTNCTWWSALVSNSTVGVSLYVWDGQFGNTNLGDALMFYSEFANQGDL
jgi:type IV pilus modification protein PilV